MEEIQFSMDYLSKFSWFWGFEFKIDKNGMSNKKI
jgi:hypothetical protein